MVSIWVNKLTKETEGVLMANSYKESNKEGAIREIIAARILMEADYNVSLPLINTRYDLIAEKYPFIARVQVKPLLDLSTGDLSKWEIRAFSNPAKTKRLYSTDDCDFIMAVTNDAQHFAIIPVEEIPGSGIVRVSTHRTNTRGKYLDSFVAFTEPLSKL